LGGLQISLSLSQIFPFTIEGSGGLGYHFPELVLVGLGLMETLCFIFKISSKIIYSYGAISSSLLTLTIFSSIMSFHICFDFI
jgi:hypothetical protein